MAMPPLLLLAACSTSTLTGEVWEATDDLTASATVTWLEREGTWSYEAYLLHRSTAAPGAEPPDPDACNVVVAAGGIVAGEPAGAAALVVDGEAQPFEQSEVGTYLPLPLDGLSAGAILGVTWEGSDRQPALDAPDLLELPAIPELSEPTAGLTTSADDPLLVSWTGTSPHLARIAVTVGDELVVCSAEDDGSHEVPADLLAPGPASVFVERVATATTPHADGVLMFGTIQRSEEISLTLE